jgi:hypothetical protein
VGGWTDRYYSAVPLCIIEWRRILQRRNEEEDATGEENKERRGVVKN